MAQGRGKGKTPNGLDKTAHVLYMYSRRFHMLALRIDPETEKRLEALAARTGRTKSFYAREAILAQLEDLEDFYLAEDRLKDFRAEDAISLADLKAELDLEN
jgi:RHH-type rel operon transcriptional repressor/antitoxin RelB